MNISSGVDIVSISRIRKALKKFGDRFAKRILTERELKEFYKRKDKIQFLASRFAGKEAVYKAFNISPFSWQRIEILKKNEKPKVFIDRKLAENIDISISHERDYAIAFCIVVK